MTPRVAVEQALSTVLRKYSKLGEKVQVRAWSILAADGTVGDAGLREYPLVDVRAAPAAIDDNQHTSRISTTIISATKDGDDPQHVFVTGMDDAVQTTLDRLFSQWMKGNEAGAEYAAFLAALAALLPPATVGYTFTFSGFSFGDGLSPRNENGANMIGTTLIVHYGRSDF